MKKSVKVAVCLQKRSSQPIKSFKSLPPYFPLLLSHPRASPPLALPHTHLLLLPFFSLPLAISTISAITQPYPTFSPITSTIHPPLAHYFPTLPFPSPLYLCFLPLLVLLRFNHFPFPFFFPKFSQLPLPPHSITSPSHHLLPAFTPLLIYFSCLLLFLNSPTFPAFSSFPILSSTFPPSTSYPYFTSSLLL